MHLKNWARGRLIYDVEAWKLRNEGKKRQVSSETLSRIKRLIADLRSYDGVVRREARQTLVFIGKWAVDSLIPLLKDSDDEVRWEAAKVLAEIAVP